MINSNNDFLYNESAEQAVICILLSKPDSFALIADLLKPESFYRTSHKIIFEEMSIYQNKGIPIDLITLIDNLKAKNILEESGGAQYISDLAISSAYSENNLIAYAQVVKDKHTLREIKQAGIEIAALPLTKKTLSSDEILNEAEEKLFNLHKNAEEKTGMRHANAAASAVFKRMEINGLNEGALLGISTGFKELDKVTSGLQAGELTIIAARPSMGKTALGVNIAEHVAIREGKTVLFHSMEMNEEAIGFRLYSSLTGINQENLKHARLRDEDWTRINQATDDISKSKLHFDESSSLTPLDVRSTARKIAFKYPVDLIIVDYLQLMHPVNKAENKNLEVSEISKSLKAIAKDLKIPIIALAQLNRSVENRPNKRPVLSDLRDSGSIEQDADVIILIYRDEYYDKETREPGVTELIVAKNRNGETKTLKLKFVGSRSRFENV